MGTTEDGCNQSDSVMNGSTVFAWVHPRLVFPASKKKIWLILNCYCCHFFWPIWYFGDFITAFLSRCVMGGWETTAWHERTHLVKCVFAETAGVSQEHWLPVVCLYCINYTAGLWIICREAVLRITGHSFFCFFFLLSKKSDLSLLLVCLSEL